MVNNKKDAEMAVNIKIIPPQKVFVELDSIEHKDTELTLMSTRNGLKKILL